MSDFFEGLSPNEADLIGKLLETAQTQAEESMKPRQIRDIVPIEKWLENEYYVGPDGVRIYDFWKAEMCDIFGSHNGQYNEIILEGGLGTGKSTVGIYLLIRKLYEMSCYENIPALFDLMSTATIVFMYFTISRSQAEIAGYGQFRDTIDSIPYFRDCFPRDPNISSILKFPEHILFNQGSSTQHQIGLNLIATILDEANFFNQGQVSDKAALSAVTALHTSVINRGVSRFMKGGVNNSMSILISSPTYSSSYTQQRIAQAVGNPHTKVIKCRLWDVKPSAYSPKKFPVFCGTEKLDPFLVNSVADLAQVAATEKLPVPEGDSLEEAMATMDKGLLRYIDQVPIDFRDTYEKNLVQALQDISGYSVAPSGRLFSSRVLLNNCIDPDLPDVFTKTELVISTGDYSDANSIAHYMQASPKNRSAVRYMHMDQSVTTDSTGMAMAWRSGEVERDGQKLPIITIDWALRVNPPAPPEKISITRCRAFIVHLVKNLRYPMGLVTYDQFQCLTGDTLVTIPGGYKRLEDMCVGDVVRTDTGNHVVEATHKYPGVETVVLYTKRKKRLEGTPNHRIRVLKRWMYQSGRRLPVWEDRRLDEIAEGDILDVRYQESEGTVSFGEVNSELLAYLIGYAIGDGNFSVDGWRYVFGNDVEEGYVCGLVRSYYEEEGIRGNPTTGVYSRELVRRLEKNDMWPKREGEKYVPDKFRDLNTPELLALLNGIIDSDGSLTKDCDQLTIATTNESIRDFIMYIGEYRMGVKVRYTVDEKHRGHFGKEGKPIYYVGFSGIGQERLCHEYGRKLDKSRIRQGRMVFERVSRIERSCNDVFDITVSDDSHYIANGFYSHNSAESQQVLNEIGIKSAQLSVDRTDEQYLALVDLIYDGRLKASKQVVDLMATEIFDLIHYRSRRKVDHPPEGSKDVMDAVVGAVWNAINGSDTDRKRREDGKHLAEHNAQSDPETLEEEITKSFLQAHVSLSEEQLKQLNM